MVLWQQAAVPFVSEQQSFIVENYYNNSITESAVLATRTQITALMSVPPLPPPPELLREFAEKNSTNSSQGRLRLFSCKLERERPWQVFKLDQDSVVLIVFHSARARGPHLEVRMTVDNYHDPILWDLQFQASHQEAAKLNFVCGRSEDHPSGYARIH